MSDDTTVSRYYQFGCNVFGLDSSMEPMQVAKKSIELTAEFLYRLTDRKVHFQRLELMKRILEVSGRKQYESCGLKDAFKTTYKGRCCQYIQDV